MVGTLGAGWLAGGNRSISDCPDVCPKIEFPRVECPVCEGPNGEIQPEQGKTPSLLMAFREGIAQDFSGPGTRNAPSCQYSEGKLVAAIPNGYGGFAGCSIEVDNPLNLKAFVNGVVRVNLTESAKRLDIKLEAGPQGAARKEVFIVKAPAAAGPHTFPVKDVPPEVLSQARRLTVAVSDSSGKGTTITIYE
jgi:hypothetical protein